MSSVGSATFGGVIHPTALVDPSAVLAADVRVGAFSVVEAGVTVAAGARLAEHVILRQGAAIGAGCVLDSYSVIGGAPQMRGEPVGPGAVEIGARAVLREGVTINCPTKAGGRTSVGAGCMLMANSHVGHDCEVGEGVTLANNVMLAGHVRVGDGCFLGGGVGVHQFVRVGARAMIGGNASMSYDVPPYAMAAERNELRGLNLVGLRRLKVASAAVADLKRAYHAVYAGPGDFRARAAEALAGDASGNYAQGREFLEFFVGGERGFVHPIVR